MGTTVTFYAPLCCTLFANTLIEIRAHPLSLKLLQPQISICRYSIIFRFSLCAFVHARLPTKLVETISERLLKLMPCVFQNGCMCGGRTHCLLKIITISMHKVSTKHHQTVYLPNQYR